MDSTAALYDHRPARQRGIVAVAREAATVHDDHAAVLAQLEGLLDRLLGMHPDGLQDGQVSAETRVLTVAKRRIEARTVELVGALTSRQAARAREAAPGDGRAGEKAAKQVAQDLAADLHVDQRDATRLVKDASKLRWLSTETRDAAGCGQLSARHLSLLHDQLLRHLDGDLRRRVEAEMVEIGASMDPAAFGRACRKKLGELDRTALATDDRTRQQRRRASVTQNDDGTVYFSGTFAGVDGEIMLTAMHAFMTPDGDGIQRTGEQRVADALVSMARCALDHADLGKQGGTKPHVTVFLTLQDLLNDGVAELAHTGPISTQVLRRLLDDSTVTRVITGPDSQIIDVGRAQRSTTPAIRTGIVGRDHHCTFDGCTVPAARCQAAHIGTERWWNGGGTSIHEQALLCDLHHDLVDRLNLTARIINGQVLWDRPPKG